LKKDKFLSKTSKSLVLKYLHKLKVVFAIISHDAKNLLKAKTIASEAFQHNSNNHSFPAKKYTIVNLRKKGESYNQTRAFKFFNKTNNIVD